MRKNIQKETKKTTTAVQKGDEEREKEKMEGVKKAKAREKD